MYNTSLEICALMFLIVVTIRFFCMRKFPSRLNRMFGLILHCAIVDLVLDIVGSYTIEYAAVVPAWCNYVLNTVFYSLQVLFPAVMLSYVLVLCGRARRRYWLLTLPAAGFELLQLINPFTHIIFYLQSTAEGLVYTRGPLFNVLYLGSAFYLVATVVAVLRYRQALKKQEFNTILAFIAFIVAAVVLQFFFPSVLLTGVAMALAILMMFFTMQNPESMLDPITGAFNQSALNEYLRVQISEARDMWVTAVDIGGIRRINSTLGLRVGNEVLESVGAFFLDVCGDEALFFRMVSAKFLLVSDSRETHQRVIREVTQRFRRPWVYGDMEVSLIATVRYCEGVCVFASPEDVINLIDLAYRNIAEEGYGSALPVGAKLLEQARRSVLVEEAVRRALESGKGFRLNFQPLYSVERGGFHNAEVLLRLCDPVLGAISPDEFILVAERTGLIGQIDSLVLRRSCGFLRAHPELLDAGLERLEINLSAAEFCHSADHLAQETFRELAGQEARICFEVTETAATTHREILSRYMENLIPRGVHFALDDFGSGYANITQLARLPFSVVKLDRSFAASLLSRDTVILEDLIKMFGRIGLTTVAEGVESEEQARFAIDAGVDYIQGYYYSRPLEEEDFLHFMLQARAFQTTP